MSMLCTSICLCAHPHADILRNQHKNSTIFMNPAASHGHGWVQMKVSMGNFLLNFGISWFQSVVDSEQQHTSWLDSSSCPTLRKWGVDLCIEMFLTVFLLTVVLILHASGLQLWLVTSGWFVLRSPVCGSDQWGVCNWESWVQWISSLSVLSVSCGCCRVWILDVYELNTVHLSQC